MSMPNELCIDAPNEKQKLFLKDSHRYIAYGGARGGGKSWAVRTKAKLLAFNYPGIKILIIRKSYPELRENHINPLCAELKVYSKDKLATYKDSTKELIFPNGSRILFGYCENDKDAMRYQGTEVDILFIDEATHQSFDNYQKLNACVRGVNSFPKRTYLTCNPGGVGHGWVKRLFVDRKFEGNEKPDEYTFIQARVTDNKALMATQPDYVDNLKALTPHLRAMWLDGSWDIHAGMVFSDFRVSPSQEDLDRAGITAEEAVEQHRFTHVIPAFDIAIYPGWKIYRSYDFGYSKPFSCAWWAVDYDGVIYRIMEYYGCTETPNEGVEMSPDEQFKQIHEIETTHPWLKGRKILGVADPAIWNGSNGISIAEVAENHGVYFDKGVNNRVPGWMQCHYRLQFDDDGYARCYIFDNCKAFIRTIPQLLYDEHKPEDIDSDLEDHVADEWRYMCMARPIAPHRPVEQRVILSDPLDQFKDKRLLRR